MNIIVVLGDVTTSSYSLLPPLDGDFKHKKFDVIDVTHGFFKDTTAMKNGEDNLGSIVDLTTGVRIHRDESFSENYSLC